MTRAEIVRQYPESMDFEFSGMPVIRTNDGFYAKFDSELDFYFGKYLDLTIIEAEIIKYFIRINS